MARSAIQKVSPLDFQRSEICACNSLLHLSKVNFDKEKNPVSARVWFSPAWIPVLADLASFPYKGFVKRQPTGFPEQQVQMKTLLHFHDKLLVAGKGSFSGAPKFLVWATVCLTFIFPFSLKINYQSSLKLQIPFPPVYSILP